MKRYNIIGVVLVCVLFVLSSCGKKKEIDALRSDIDALKSKQAEIAEANENSKYHLSYSSFKVNMKGTVEGEEEEYVGEMNQVYDSWDMGLASIYEGSTYDRYYNESLYSDDGSGSRTYGYFYMYDDGSYTSNFTVSINGDDGDRIVYANVNTSGATNVKVVSNEYGGKTVTGTVEYNYVDTGYNSDYDITVDFKIVTAGNDYNNHYDSSPSSGGVSALQPL